MLAFWPEVIKPVLAELKPLSMVEIGSESGKVTRLLIELAVSHGGRVCAIDPNPGFDVGAWERQFGPVFRFHRLRSLEVLPTLERFDAVLIDGDHNWYTVRGELDAIESRSRTIGQPMPIVFLHDVGWPYGRRDLYYAPETIPEQHRHPFARKGIHFESNALVDRGGINAHLCNAVHEGGPANGVLTAVEDYLAASAEAPSFVQIPAVFGLGILLPSWVRDKHPSVAAFCDLWKDPRLERFLARLETARISSALGSLAGATLRG